MGGCVTTPAAGWATPMFHATSLERSIAFYELLGFELIDTDRSTPLGWARLHCEGGAIMLVKSDRPIDAARQEVSLYMYTADLPALRAHLITQGLAPTAICYPGYLPSGEMHLNDPDGYAVGIAHWGESEHSEWLQRIGRKP